MNVSSFPTNFKLGPWSIELGKFLLKSQNVSLLHFNFQQIKLEIYHVNFFSFKVHLH